MKTKIMADENKVEPEGGKSGKKNWLLFPPFTTLLFVNS
jgi:hypothetical protein